MPNKSVMLSIQPYWVFLIIAKTMDWNIDKEKTVEVRKTFPKDENWNKVAKIYCSKDKNSFAKIPSQYKPLVEQFLGKVIGEFVCDEIKMSIVGYDKYNVAGYHDLCEGSCLSNDELMNYGKWRILFGWHISDLVIYDKPKELSELVTYCKYEFDDDFEHCEGCPHYYYSNTPSCGIEEYCGCDGLKPITRPPQSWCYVGC